MSSGSGLPPSQHAAFAVTSRLISCLVTEQILKGLYVPISTSAHATGLLVVLSTDLIPAKAELDRVLLYTDVFALVPLRHAPIFHDEGTHRHAQSVALVDPLDMYPEILELHGASSVLPVASSSDLEEAVRTCLVSSFGGLGPSVVLAPVQDPIYLWNKYVHSVTGAGNTPSTTIEREIKSSFDYQLYAYQNPPKCPSLASSPIEWEQSLVAGHPTHPTHRARVLATDIPYYDWYQPRILFARVPRSELKMSGPFEDLIRGLAELAAKRSGRELPNDPSSVLMPVHEMQVPNICKRFANVEILHPDISHKAQAQASIRTVVIPELPGMALKLAVAVKISSGLRTISHFTADYVPRWAAEIVPKLKIDRSILFACPESATAVHSSDDPEIAEQFTAVIREEYRPGEGEALIVCAALLETDHAGAPIGISSVENAFNLKTPEKRAAFLDRYIQLACQAFLPPLIHNGVAFEVHAQNVLARFDVATGKLLGFVLRDMGGLHVHPPTLRQSTGVNFQFLPGHVAVSHTLEETYPGFYHAFIHNHIQRLTRILGLHYDGRGWEMLRRHLSAQIPADHALRKLWLSPDSKTVLSKYLLRMKTSGMYRDMLYSPVPNLIQYRGEEKWPVSEQGRARLLHLNLD